MSRVYRELMSSRWCGVTTEGRSRVVVGVCKANLGGLGCGGQSKFRGDELRAS